MKNLAIGIWVPTRVRTTERGFHSSHAETAFQCSCDIFFHRLTGTACQNLYSRLLAINVDDGKIRGCLHNSRNSWNHAQYAIMASVYRVDEVVLYLFRNFSLWKFCFFSK